MAGKVKLTRYRSRWLEHAGLVVVEREHERLAFGFWPVREWESVSYFVSHKKAAEWIVSRNAGPAISFKTQTGSGETGNE